MVGKTVQVSGFPMNVTAEGVKNFLESYTGVGSIFAVKVRHPKTVTTRSKAFAIVQFQTSKDAVTIYNELNGVFQQYFYPTTYLKVQDKDRDIVPKPRKPLFVLENATLHLGCLISEEALGVLWSCTEVNIHFGFNMKKISFFLAQGNQSYKLELSCESIWDIQQRCSPAQRSQFLVIQVHHLLN